MTSPTISHVCHDGLIFRTARKEWKCQGNGAPETIQVDTGRRHKISEHSMQIVMGWRWRIPT